MAIDRRGLLLLLPCLAGALGAAGLPEEIQRAMNGSPAARTAYWGIEIADAASGRVLFGENADHLFVPASNTKLFTTALALTRLGADYRFVTTVRADAPPDSSGTIEGNLRL